MLITPLTPLDAVNEILSSIGESPVNTLDDPSNIDVINAIRILDTVTKQVQQKGWSFNSVSSYTLMPDRFTREIAWDNQLLRVKSAEGNILRKRNGIVYDVTNNTDKFTSNIEVEAVTLVNFEDMPEVFREYVTARAARVFSARYLGDDGLLQVLAQEEQLAYSAMMEYEIDIEEPSMANNMDIMNMMKR